jgi:hypothetical protein
MKGLRLERYALSAGVVIALLAGCGGSQPPIGAPGAMPQTGARASGQVDAWLYVTGNHNNEVAIYDLDKSGFPIVGTITDGVSSPGGVAVDKKGQVYVANETGTVTIYAPGKRTPSLTNLGSRFSGKRHR